MSDDQILDLAELAPKRRQVRFEEGGDLYDMVTPDDLTISERAHLFGLHTKMERITESKTGLNKDASKQLEKHVTEAARIVLPDVPQDVFDRLSDFKKEAVVLGFMSAFGNTIKRLAEATGGEDLIAAMEAISES